MINSWLILVLYLIGSESGTSFLYQSQSKSKQKQSNLLFLVHFLEIVLIASSPVGIFICHLSFLFCCCFTKDPPTITSYQSAFTVNEKNNVTMTCHAKGVPQPTITWTKIGGDKLDCSGEQCTIRNTSGKNNGTYRCVARNELGEDWKEITLNVQSKFSWILDVLIVTLSKLFCVFQNIAYLKLIVFLGMFRKTSKIDQIFADKILFSPARLNMSVKNYVLRVNHGKMQR